MLDVITAVARRALWYVLALLVVVCVVLWLALKATRADVAAQAARLASASAHQAALQLDISALTRAIEQGEADKAAIWQQLAALDAADVAYQAQLGGIDAQQEKLAQTLSDYRMSNDESLKNWMAQPVPGAARSLLSHAAECAHRDRRGAEACRGAQAAGKPLPGATD